VIYLLKNSLKKLPKNKDIVKVQYSSQMWFQIRLPELSLRFFHHKRNQDYGLLQQFLSNKWEKFSMQLKEWFTILWIETDRTFMLKIPFNRPELISFWKRAKLEALWVIL